ncbi:hypothetical protein F2Q69_00059135 [Brassica cretica]|uniref:Uncharacterized protein n=1 Tax=Brassica cretica TaxID=69181 RepID=A0A8S9RP79_BRACR|nr:hypothetical protein F2Q69_00059135 [Brassica cretica]
MRSVEGYVRWCLVSCGLDGQVAKLRLSTWKFSASSSFSSPTLEESRVAINMSASFFDLVYEGFNISASFFDLVDDTVGFNISACFSISLTTLVGFNISASL